MPMPTLRFALNRVFSLALVAAAACADSPSSPTSAPPPDAGLARGHERPGNQPDVPGYKLVTCTGRGPAERTMVIGPEGGTMHVGPNVLTIPSGALEVPTSITARVADTLAAVHFEPHGLRFFRPVLLQLDTRGCAVRAEEHPVLLYLEHGALRETIGGSLDDRKHTFSAPIEHFSVYAIGV